MNPASSATVTVLPVQVWRAAASQWRKLRRPGLLWPTLAAVVGVAALATAISIAAADSTAGRPPGGPNIGVSSAALQQAGGLTNGLSSAATLLGVVALCVAAGAVASEYSLGTLRNLLIRQPRRLRLFAGTALTLAAFTTLMVLAAAASSVVASFAAAAATGLDTTQWGTAAAWRAMAETTANTTVSTLGWTGLGFTLAVLLRTPIAAIAVGVAYALPVESIVAASLDDAKPYLPGQLLTAIASGGTADLGYRHSLAFAAAYTVAAAIGVALLLTRRDVNQ